MSEKRKLLDIVRDKIRFKHYSYSTEKLMLVGLNSISSFMIKSKPKQKSNFAYF